jgi:Flp pilus assembly protein protease CpaA
MCLRKEVIDLLPAVAGLLICLVVAYTDYKYRRIYNYLVLATIVVAVLIHRTKIIPNLIHALILFTFLVVMAFILKDTSMGGDIKFLSALAMLLGKDVYFAITVTCILFLVAGVVIYVKNYNKLDRGLLRLKLPLGVFLPFGVFALLILKIITQGGIKL